MLYVGHDWSPQENRYRRPIFKSRNPTAVEGCSVRDLEGDKAPSLAIEKSRYAHLDHLFVAFWFTPLEGPASLSVPLSYTLKDGWRTGDWVMTVLRVVFS